MEDLTPDGLVATTPYLKELLDARLWIEEAAAGNIPAGTIAGRVRTNWPGLPLDLSLPDEGAKTPSTSAVDDLLAMVAVPTGTNRPAAGAGGPSSWKIQIGHRLVAAEFVLDLRESDFRNFEATWQGAELVMRQGIAPAGADARLYLVRSHLRA